MIALTAEAVQHQCVRSTWRCSRTRSPSAYDAARRIEPRRLDRPTPVSDSSIGCLWTALIVASSNLSAQQQPLPEWRLSGPRLEIGRDGVELHRVRAAAWLPGGGIAIADGGNARSVLVLRRDELGVEYIAVYEVVR